MEATATVNKGTADAKAREMSAKAKQAAQADMAKSKPVLHNINTGKAIEGFDVDKNAKGVKQHDKPKPKEKPITMTSKLDEILTKGGKWADLVSQAEAHSKLLNGHIKYNIGVLKAHIRYRTVSQSKKDYLGELTVTETGIEKVTTKPKGKK